MYEYKCKVIRVVDGDTVDVDIDLGFGVWLHKERVRIQGIDTPESRTRDKVEKRFGLLAKEELKDAIEMFKRRTKRRDDRAARVAQARARGETGIVLET